MPFNSKSLMAAAGVMAMATLLVGASAATSSVEAATCKSSTVTGGVGRNLTRSIAERNARIKWRAKVRVTQGLGWPWSDWDKAKDRSYSCGTYGAIYKKWGCRARARPCK